MSISSNWRVVSSKLAIPWKRSSLFCFLRLSYFRFLLTCSGSLLILRRLKLALPFPQHLFPFDFPFSSAKSSSSESDSERTFTLGGGSDQAEISWRNKFTNAFDLVSVGQDSLLFQSAVLEMFRTTCSSEPWCERWFKSGVNSKSQSEIDGRMNWLAVSFDTTAALKRCRPLSL